ncbi:MAG: hypothetical protein ACI8YC_001234 [Salibacteraceae bacterium]|jgi:hypothetical protein
MARRRSYFSKSNKNDMAGVFLNNCIASQQKSKKAEEAAMNRARKEGERERERERVRLAKEAERERVRLERERAKLANERAKFNAKATAVAGRLELEFEKIGLHPGKQTVANIAIKAVQASVSPAKAKSYYIDGKEDALAQSCAVDFLELKISSEYQHLAGFPLMVDIVKNCRPQKDAEKDKRYMELKAEIDNEIKELIAKAQREAEREKVVKALFITKLMFNDELGEFFDIMEENDWGKEESINSDTYKERVAHKAKYVAKVQSHITPFKLS